MTSAARVCLSYQAADAGAVIDRLVAALAVGFEVVRAPDPADHAETDPLDGCDALLLVVGPDWHDRVEEQDDLGVSLLEQAADHALPVVIVLLEATPPPDLGDLATVRLREEAYAHDIAELFQTVERLTSPQPSPEPEEPERNGHWMRTSSSPCTGHAQSDRRSGTTCWPSLTWPSAGRTHRRTNRIRWPR